MYPSKAINTSLAILMLLNLTNTALALPDTNNNTASQEAASAISQINNEDTQTVSIAEPSLDEALAEADAALHQEQAKKIREELDRLGNELESLNTDYMAENSKLANIQAKLIETQDKLRWYQAEYDAQRKIMEDRIADIYKQGKVEPLEALLNNTSFSEIFARISLLIKIGEQDVELLERLRDQKQKVEAEQEKINALYEEQQKITEELAGKKKAIEEKIQQEAAILASLDAQTKEMLAKLEEQQKQEQAEVINRLTKESSNASQSRISLQPGTIGFEALKYLGVPYVWGGENPNIGLDCSGLVKIVFQKFGIDLPHYSRAQARLGIPVGYDELQPGDLVFFGNPIHHVGIYLGEGYYIHAPKRNDVVKISRMSDRSDHAGARRIISITQ